MTDLANSVSTHVLAWAIGPWEIAGIVIVILILFGGKKLPELARGLGKGFRELKKGLRGEKDDVEEAAEKGDDSKEEPPASKKDRDDNPQGDAS